MTTTQDHLDQPLSTMAVNSASSINFLQCPINNVGRDQFNYHLTNNIAADLGLERLNPVEMDASDRSECFLGTRVDVIESIRNWASNPDSEHKVLWLHGVAGSGKSTLATTIANLFRKMGRLGTFVFFDREIAERSHPAVVIRTTAYQLARNHPHTIGVAISAVIDKFPSIAESPLRLQFSKLLVEPLLTCANDIPIVLVFDALDECSNRDDRQNLMAVLAEESAHLPSALRIIIASRAEYDIRTAFASKSHILTQELDITTEANTSDIRSYFRNQMAIIRNTRTQLPFPPNWPGDEITDSLTERAFGLFIWASTAVDFIRNAHYPVKRLDTLLKEGPASGAATAIDMLYRTALNEAGRWDDQDFVADFRAVLGIVLVAKDPLSIRAIDIFLGIPSDNTVSFLNCLLTQSPTVRVLHPSFADFLLSPQRSQRDPWFIDAAFHNHSLTVACLDRLHATLKRNICDLTFSTTQVNASVSEDMTYSCIYWIEHVCAVDDEVTEMRKRVDHFLVLHLLHWIEAMSVLKRSRDIVKLLSHLHDWIDTHFPDEPSDLVEDARRFSQAFMDPIADHPLSVYYSALPFTPTHSTLFQTFHDMLSFPTVVGGFETSWSPLLLVFSGHSTRIASAAVSCDGTRVACGSWPDISGPPTIRVWDLRSGIEELSLLSGHEDGVSSLAFSSDGALLVSGGRGGDLRVWDAISGTRVLGPLQAHTVSISIVAFSPDGKRIVSISRAAKNVYSELRVWDASLGISLLESRTGAIFSMAFSPDGTQIAIAFGNSAIEVYDTLSGQIIYGPLRPRDGDDGDNTDETISVLWSPCSKRIFTCSMFDRIFVWDMESLTEITSFIHLHDSYLTALAISHDGTYFATASEYQSVIRVWDLTSSREVLPALRGHKDTISLLAFSPDSNQLISGSWDQTIRVWDVNSAKANFPSHDGNFHRTYAFSNDGKRVVSGSRGGIHVRDVSLDKEILHVDTRHLPQDIRFVDLAFSSDGQQIVSSASDKTVRMWNAISGEEIFTKQLHLFDEIPCVLFSPDGMVIAAGVSRSICIWHTSSGDYLHPPLRSHTDAVTCLAFSHDSSHIASGSSDKAIRVWDVASGDVVLSPPPAHQHWITSVAFSPSDKRIVSVSYFQLCSWDMTSGTCLSVINMDFTTHRLHRIHNRIGITHQDGYVVDFQSSRILSRLPPSVYTSDGTILYMLTLAAHEGAVALSTRSGQSIILQFPPTVLSGFDTRPSIVPIASPETDDLLPIEIFNKLTGSL